MVSSGMPKSFQDKSGLELATAVQQALLDCDLPHCQCGKVYLENRMIEDVGGDFYHFKQLGSDQMAFAVGDVMGHGTSAALIMSVILGVLQADRTDKRRPDRVINVINDLLLRLGNASATPILCSMIYGIIDMPSGLLLYINAGHPTPVIYNRQQNTIQHLPTTSLVLGVEPLEISEHCHQFNTQDRLFLFTDGIFEVRNERDELFGQDRLEQLIASHGPLPSEEISHILFDESSRFCSPVLPDDDQTLVIIDFDHEMSPSL